ncbi:MAG: YebC/PmpR family DNA-binding transcriptional regulator [Deltaproteobacteria bacterium]|nr:YebC/PmpR family DNA-binding transcriptional regulator [Candidatus Anaeroferrophillus wilburensis]MBN2888741.1 YebC/PmpR family DNA-binding transcriptional regulator [Deltaproteobacteria bacterium]
MSGHNKWSSIKHRKGAVDAKRGKIFTKLIKEITVAARQGGGDIDANPRLRSAVAAAKAVNMPKENIDRSIKRGTGEMEGVNYEELTYEGYGPGGVAVMVEILTDNRNRTAAEIRHIFNKSNGNLGENGCVSWIFDKKGLIVFEKKDVEEEALFDLALETGADDVDEIEEDGTFEVLTDPENYEPVKQAFDDRGWSYVSAEVTRIPQNTVKLEGKEAEQMLRLMEKLEDSDDVQNVYANFDIDNETLEQFQG